MKSFLKNYLSIIVGSITLVGLVLDFVSLVTSINWLVIWGITTFIFSVETIIALLLHVYYGCITRDLVWSGSSTAKKVFIHVGLWVLVAEIWGLHLIAYAGAQSDPNGYLAVMFAFVAICAATINIVTYCGAYRSTMSQSLLPV